MLKRGYIILIAGGASVFAGIIMSTIWAGSFAGQFLQENTIIGQTLVRPSESINATLQVNHISRPISVALRLDPQSANVILRETVIDPSGKVVNTNEFLKDFFTTFKVNTVGKFTLTILNQGTTPANFDGLFGHIPFGFVGQNDQIDLSSLNGIITGIILFVLGIMALIVGIIFIIIDRREGQQPSSLTR